MFYKIIRPIARFIVWILNGHLHVVNKEKIPEGNYILAAPHRTWWEPILFALAASPKEFMFMSKEELFKNPILRFILRHAHAFPVDRENPGPSVIKYPVKNLRNSDYSLIMFPSGTRHSAELKGGVLLIAKMSGVPIIPAVYQGPITFGGLLKRKPMTIAFGDPITIDKKSKINDESTAAFNQQLDDAWQKVDNSVDPDFKYIPQ